MPHHKCMTPGRIWFLHRSKPRGRNMQEWKPNNLQKENFHVTVIHLESWLAMVMFLMDTLCYYICFEQRMSMCGDRGIVCVCVWNRGRDCTLWGFRTHRVQPFPRIWINNTPHKQVSVNSSFSACVCEHSITAVRSLSGSLAPVSSRDISVVLIVLKYIWAATRQTTKPIRSTRTNIANSDFAMGHLHSAPL